MTDRRPKADQLLEKARNLPRVPGVYLMKDEKGLVIYVGKAVCLPDRVSSYFVPSAAHGLANDPRKLPMLDIIDDFDIVECEGEWEALLTENRLIKDIHPRFNARLTDGKTFPYLAVTMREDFPGIYITRQPSDEAFRGAKIWGPFTNTYALRQSIQLLQRVFKFRTCQLEIREGDDSRRHFRPCLLHPIGQCTAPCAARISQDGYRADIDRFVRFLESKRSVMLREMRAEMEAASASQEYERAACLRDQIQAIEKLEERGRRTQRWQPETESFYVDPRKGLRSLQKALGATTAIRCIECIDIAHLQGGETVGSKVSFVDGRPFKNDYRRYRIKGLGRDQGAVSVATPVPATTSAGDDYAAIREVVSRRYREAGAGHELYPDLIIIDGGLGQLHAAQEAFGQLDARPPLVISLAKKEELIYHQAQAEPIRLARTNPGLKLCQAIRDEAHRFAQHYHHILRRKKQLGES